MENVIKDQINDDVASSFKVAAYNGIMYYRSKNTAIKTRKKENLIIEYDHKIANGFLKKIIDQKINYLLGKKFTLDNADNITKILDVSKCHKLIKKTAKEAAKKAVEWIHPYIDRLGEFKVTTISGLECIPVYDTEYQEELIQMIRYYKLIVVDKDKKVSRYKVEVWDKEKVTYYMQDSQGFYNLDSSMDINPLYHISINTTLGNKVVSTQFNGWGKVPFIPLWNNEDRINDLEPIKEHIDMYDIVESDFANNLDQMQDSLMMLKNRSPEDYSEFIKKLKKYKIIEVDEAGDVSFITMNIPVEARNILLTILRDNIFEFGQAVDTRRVADGNTTNVVIKSRYADLDLKCDDFETMVESTMFELFWFVNKYLEIKNLKTDNISEIEITFNRNIIFNTSETVEGFVKQGGTISNKTLLKNHPYVNDVEDEEKQIELESNGFNEPEETVKEIIPEPEITTKQLDQQRQLRNEV
jgi:SPP1 family phage portal protein